MKQKKPKITAGDRTSAILGKTNVNAAAKNQRRDIAERTDVKQGAPPEFVDKPESHIREDQVRGADTDGLKHRGALGKSGPLKDSRREVQDRVDTGELVEKRHQDRNPAKAAVTDQKNRR